MTERPRVLALVGPTAAGKSALGLELAERLGLPILCLDSVQVYRGLDIGSAKPTPADRARVRHELLDLVDPDATFSAGDYARAAWSLLGRGGGLFVGGTGFYLRATAFTGSGGEGAGEGDAADDPRRVSFMAEWEARERASAGSIHGELSRRDPETAAAVHPRNLVRALRALWLCELHGRPVSEVRRRDPPRARVDLGMIVLDPGVEIVDRAIDRRCEAMLAAGWLDEVEMLRRRGYDARHKAMRSLGYSQLLAVVEGRQRLVDASAEIKAATRAYARRQRTYFRHQLPAAWRVDLRDPAAAPWAAIEAFALGGTP